MIAIAVDDEALMLGALAAAVEASEDIACISAPWFKHYDKEWIDRYAEVFFKVARNYTQLLEDDLNKKQGGIWYGAESDRKK